MNLYRISQDANGGYDTFDSAVVVAATEDDAKLINPQGEWIQDIWSAWCKTPDQVKVELIGTALDSLEAGTIVVASYNAG